MATKEIIQELNEKESYQGVLEDLRYVNAICNNFMVSVDLAARELLQLLYPDHPSEVTYSLSNKDLPRSFLSDFDKSNFNSYLVFAMCMQICSYNPVDYLEAGGKLPPREESDTAYSKLIKREAQPVKALVKNFCQSALDMRFKQILDGL